MLFKLASVWRQIAFLNIFNDHHISFIFQRISSHANSVADIMSAGLFCQLLVCATSLAVYMVGIESNVNAKISIVISILGSSCTLASTYIFCHLSEYVTRDLCAIGEFFYNFGWYQLPLKKQVLFILPIQQAQIEFRMTGLGIVECSLRVFTSVGSQKS